MEQRKWCQKNGQPRKAVFLGGGGNYRYFFKNIQCVQSKPLFPDPDFRIWNHRDMDLWILESPDWTQGCKQNCLEKSGAGADNLGQ